MNLDAGQVVAGIAAQTGNASPGLPLSGPKENAPPAKAEKRLEDKGGI